MRFLIVAVLTLVVSGCASLTNNPGAANLAIQLGVMKVIEADEANTRARAEKIRAIAAEAQTFLDTADVTLPLLESAIDARLTSLDLAPSDVVLARALAASVVAELNARVGSGVLSPEQRITVTQVLSAVEKAASYYL